MEKRFTNGDIVKVPVRRLSSNHSTWWKKTNKNHGEQGDFVYKKIEFRLFENNYVECLSGFKILDLPITKEQIKAIEKPRGKERNNQTVDDINFKYKDLEVIRKYL